MYTDVEKQTEPNNSTSYAKFPSASSAARTRREKLVFATSVLALGILITAASVVAILVFFLYPRKLKKFDASPFGDNPAVILVSLDGFRHDYLSRHSDVLPTLNRLAQTGARVSKLQPIYPSKTFPNHYTIATGLYPESHGIISNHMYDPEFNEVFEVGGPNIKDPKWWNGEPIWITAQKQGLKSGAVFWPGTDVKIKGVLPTYYREYSGTMSNYVRVDTLLSYLYEEQGAPQFMTLYFSDADDAGHRYGPDSPEVKAALKRIDDALKYLTEQIEYIGLRQYIDIVIVSDHGMTSTSNSRVIDLRKYIDLDLVKIYNYGPFADVWVKDPSFEEMIYGNLTEIPHATTYYREDIPQRFHFQNNRRISNILVMAEAGYSIEKKSYVSEAGAHGYDNSLDSMAAILIATGPSFKNNGYVKDTTSNIEVYMMLCDLLDIEPAPNNGTGKLNDLFNF